MNELKELKNNKTKEKTSEIPDDNINTFFRYPEGVQEITHEFLLNDRKQDPKK
jgi:hypothetical protein